MCTRSYWPLLYCAILLSPPLRAHTTEEQPASEDGIASSCENAEMRSLAKDAFVYGYPAVELFRLRKVRTNTTTQGEHGAPVNLISHRQSPLTHKDVNVVSPNNDT